ncbi:MAG: S9 family peptidase [Planctomycetota bacterium]|nr:MAG: S9 family peptidase [Planctomycetota bacterium]
MDPSEGAARPATAQDRQSLKKRSTALRWGKVFAPDADRFARLESGRIRFAGGDLGEGFLATEKVEKGVQWTVTAEGWASDGSRFFASKIDRRPVHQLPLVDYTQAVETVRFHPYLKAGTTFGQFELVIFELPGGKQIQVDLGELEEFYLFPLGWRDGDRELLFLRLNRPATRLDLMAADPENGTSRVILTERQDTFVAGLDFIVGGWRDRFTPITGSELFLWISERDGWRHLYLFNYQGELIRQITRGDFPVKEVLAADPEKEMIYLLANAESRLYDTHFYSVGMDGEGFRRLSQGEGEHEISISPSFQYFVDRHSSLKTPPVNNLYHLDGQKICTLAEAEVGEYRAMGWQPPEAFWVKAADGKTDLAGVLFKPKYFDPEVRYPVIDFIYSGPFITVVPNDYTLRSPMAPMAHAMAQLGFIVMILDPRGTVERGKAFQDASYGRIGEIEIPDHVAALDQLAADRPFMDMDRVGVYGHSWGGYFALRAMLTAPEVFHVGVAGAPGELTEAAPINEPYMGLPQENPEGYQAGLNAPLAQRLAGKLLIIHGTADVNAPFSTSMRMVDALIRADREFDLLVLPGAGHNPRGVQGQYESKRIRSYFLEHLRGEAGLWADQRKAGKKD